MAKPAKIKQQAADTAVPQNRAQAVDFLSRIGRHQRELMRIETAMNDEMAAIKESYEELARPHRFEVDALTSGLRIWCEANRDALTGGGKIKSVELEAGVVKWRLTPPRVVVRGIEAVLDQLRRMGLTQFIREKEELDKEAVLADPKAVAGVKGLSISQHEDFVVEPFDVELEKTEVARW